MKKGKNIEVPPTTRTDGTKVTLKKATVESYLKVAKELAEFLNREPEVKEFFGIEFDKLCRKEEEKVQALDKETGGKISSDVFPSLANACFFVSGLEEHETFYKMLQLLGIEVME